MQKAYQTQDLPRIESAKIAILQASWHADYTNIAVTQCEQILLTSGASLEKHLIPGSLELAYAAKTLLSSDKVYDGLICFGAIIKGDTYHFEIVADSCAQGLMQVSLEYSVPIINEVLACYNIDQLIQRCSNDEKNKGIEGAFALIHIIDWKRNLITSAVS